MTSNCPACGAPLGNSTGACPFCGYSLAATPEKPASDALYNPPVETPVEVIEEPVAVEEPPVFEPAPARPEPEPVYRPPEPSPIDQLAGTGRAVRKTGAKVAIGIVIGVILVCVACVLVTVFAILPIFQNITTY